MKVVARPGAQCPMEGKPREYIGPDSPVEVQETAYYMRLIEDGSLIRISDAQAKKKGGKG